MTQQTRPGRVGPVPVVHPPRDETGVRRVPLDTLASKVALSEPSGAPPTSLLAAYQAWKQRQAELPAPTVKAAKGVDDEATALRKSRKRLRKSLASGTSPVVAVAVAHAHYRAKGGRSGLAVWARKVAAAG